MSNPPVQGRDAKGEASGLPIQNSQGASYTPGIREIRRKSHSIPASTPKGNAQQALNDAQQSLHALLNPPTEQDQPQVISPSGAARSQRRGRVAGLSLDDGRQTKSIELQTAHVISSIAHRLPAPGNGQSSAQSRRDLIVFQTRNSLQAVQERAMMLVHPVDGESELGIDAHATQSARRAAAQWVTRYATHLVILLVIGALVAFGGLRTLTVAKAYPHSLIAAGMYTGTDYTDEADNQSASGKPDSDSQDYQLTLPRTELSSSMPPASAKNAQSQASNNGATKQGQAASPAAQSADVNRYTVVEGDTIAAIADKFNVMPETVMGSNGMFDLGEELAPGRALIVPPVDGMYYVAAKGDTLFKVAHKFQVEPKVITSYSANKIGPDGTIQEGTPLVVPGGMMPERETAIAYTVRRGDTLKHIAARFGIDVPTLINSNNIPDPDNLQPATKLRILPVQGMEYKVKKGDTITTIADRYGATPQMILDYSPNHLSLNSALQIDQVIILPGGNPPTEVVAAARVSAPQEPTSRGSARPPDPQPSEQRPAKAASDSPKPQPKDQPKPQPKVIVDNAPTVGTGRLMWPVDGVITQYFSSRHNGIDIATDAGTPIHAADSGEVIWAGWRTDGLGYCVMIDHQDGYSTVYGHMIRQPSVYVGQYVKRGQVIGNIGSTGHSTGPHVHFMVKGGSGDSHNYRNPLSFLK